MSVTDSERDRIAAEYARRAGLPALDDLYSPLRTGALLEQQRREEAIARLFRRLRIGHPGSLRLLDVGCGTGTPLLRWIALGFSPERCAGVELLHERARVARHRLPSAASVVCADARTLPVADGACDVVSQFTVLSSVLDAPLRAAIAAEMLRVLAPGGVIVWYDFWINPVNPSTHGIRKSEIRALFPGCTFTFDRITLAPPLARRLSRVSSLVCRVLEGVRVLNTHYLVGIQKLSSSSR